MIIVFFFDTVALLFFLSTHYMSITSTGDIEIVEKEKKRSDKKEGSRKQRSRKKIVLAAANKETTGVLFLAN